jgi:small-conductance mechanosensitive channel
VSRIACRWWAVCAAGVIVCAAPSTPPATATGLIAHLEQTIAWYRHMNAEQDSSGASDVLLRDSTRQASTQALQLAFDFARAASALVSSAGTPNPSTPGGGTGNLQQASAKASDRVAGLTSRIADLDAKIPKTAQKERTTLTAQRKELQAELDLAKEIQDTIQNLASFSGSAGSVAGGLSGRIDELESSVPEARHQKGAEPKPGTPTKAAPAPNAPQPSQARLFQPESAGIISLAAELFSIHSGRQRVQDLARETDNLSANIDRLRRPLVDEARASISRADEIANAAPSQTPDQLAASQAELNGLTTRFKQISAALIPLGEQSISIGIARGNLEESVSAFDSQLGNALRYLLLRTGTLALGLLFVLGVSELWRRAISRYVQDHRRRRQLLVLRKVVVSCGVVVALILGFITEFGSLATYAGFVTAGVAVALQNPILSVVGYFFLIGRYGFRVGDRVTITGVTGDVLEIGLVRIYLMELSGIGADSHATGRVVVFANAVVFQPAALYKQMPGIDYVWHSAMVTLMPDTDFQLAESKLHQAVDKVYQEYRPKIEEEYAMLQQTVDLHLSVPRPESRMQYTDTGMQFTVRYPVEMRHASATDERVLTALSDSITAEPKFQVAPGGRPRLQVA